MTRPCSDVNRGRVSLYLNHRYSNAYKLKYHLMYLGLSMSFSFSTAIL